MWYIQNHHKRNPAKVVTRLTEQGATPLVVTDYTNWKDGPKDTRHTGVCQNYLNIMRHQTDDEWKIIVHDDAGIPDGFVEKINHILKYAPKAPITFYNGAGATVRKAIDKGHHVLRTYGPPWFPPAHAIPTKLATEFSEWCDKHCHPFGLIAEDGMLWAWASANKSPLYVVLPSLLQHDGWSNSLFGHSPVLNGVYRYSESYDPNFPVDTVDWVKEFENPYAFDRKHGYKQGITGVTW